jgi:hypothetical protein
LIVPKSCFIFVPETKHKDMNTITYQHLLFEYKDDVVKQLEALQRVAKRVGVAVPTWSFSDVYEYEFMSKIDENPEEEEWETFIEKVFDVTLNIEESIKMEGDWKIAAVMIHDTGSLIQIDPELEIPARYTPKVAICEHCNKSFPRVKSFLITNAYGEWKQVGKSCMKQFLGVNPISYISMFEAASKFSNFIEGVGYAKNRGGRMENLAYNVTDMLLYTIGQVQRDGEFVKAEWKMVETGYYHRDGEPKMKNVRSNEPNATIDKVRNIISATSHYKFNPEELVSDEELTGSIDSYKLKSETLNEIQKLVATTYDELYQKKLPEPKIGVTHEERMAIVKNDPEVQELKNKSVEAWDEYVAAKNLYSRKSRLEWFKGGKTYLQQNSEVLEAVIAWAATIEPKMDKWYDELEGKDVERYASGFEEFRAAVKDTFAKARVLQTNLKYICTGYNMYMKDMQYQIDNAERLAAAEHLQHVGVVGEKCHLVLKVTGMKSGSGGYGTWTLWTMEDKDGNKFTKFGTLDEKHIIEKPENTDGMIDCTIEAMFEIKKHDVYNSEKQTQLGRASKVKKAKYIKA